MFGQKNCSKHVEFYSKNKFEKLVHLVCFIIRIYHDARFSECQILHKVVGLIAVTALPRYSLYWIQRYVYSSCIRCAGKVAMAGCGPSKSLLTVTFFEHQHVLLLAFILQAQNSLLSTTVKTKPADWRRKVVSNIRQIMSVFDIWGFKSQSKFKAIAHYATEWQSNNWGGKGRP